MNTLDWNELGLDENQPTETEGGYAFNVGFKPSPIGRYTFVIDPESCEWTRKDEVLRLKYTAKRVGGDYDGSKVSFNWATSRKFKTRNASSLEDLAYAMGMPFVQGEQPTLKVVADFIQEGINAGTTFDARTDWESYCKDCGETVLRGGKAYDRDENGDRQPAKACPKCGKLLVARDRIAAYIAA